MTTVRNYDSGNYQCFVDPDSIRSVHPYPDPDPGGQKHPTKIEKIKKFHVLSAGYVNCSF
jgi:hypothetical protein